MGKNALFLLNTVICYHLSQKIPMPQIARSLKDIPYLEEKYHCMLPVSFCIYFFHICCWPMWMG